MKLNNYDEKISKYEFLTASEQTLVEVWRRNCQEREELTSKLMSLKWYEIFKQKYMLKLIKRNHQDWNYIFNKLDNLGIFKKMRKYHD